MKFLSIFCLAFLLSATASAQQSKDILADVGRKVFTEVEREIIRDVLGRAGYPQTETRDADRSGDYKKKGKHKEGHKGKGKKEKGMPPGLAKRDQLPRGLAKKERLPRGLEKRELPDALERKLPPAPRGTERVIVDSNVVLIEKGTDIILDVVRDVLRGR